MAELGVEHNDYEVDLGDLKVSSNIVEMKQEGNFIKCVTDTGIRFSKHIPQGKILNKVNGKYILQDMKVS